jgi:predicted ribosome quality control (RQC) complex YloA/Tae2 family protein
VAVDYTLRRYVDRIKGGPPGLVTYRGERTLHVPPAGLEQ